MVVAGGMVSVGELREDLESATAAAKLVTTLVIVVSTPMRAKDG